MTGPGLALFDIDGVLTVSWRPLAGASDAVAQFRHAGWRVAFLTNTTSVPRATIRDRLQTAGIHAEPDEVITAVAATARYLSDHHPGARCFLLNQGSIFEDLVGVDLVEEQADVVVTGGAGPDITYGRLNTGFSMLLEGAAFVAMHKNLSWQTAEGLQLDMGALVHALELASGRRATVVGKPSPEFYRAVLASFDTQPADAIMVGDDIEADVLGAQTMGIRGVLVRTGKFRQSAIERTDGRLPDDVIDSVVDLPALMGIATS